MEKIFYEVQKIGLSIVPIIFYFFPHFLFPKLYKNHIKSSFYDLKSESLSAYEEINKLQHKVSRVVDFISFVTIIFVTFVAVMFDKHKNEIFYRNCFLLTLIIVFLSFSGLNIFNNIKQHFMLSYTNKTLEKAIVLSTGILIYFFG